MWFQVGPSIKRYDDVYLKKSCNKIKIIERVIEQTIVPPRRRSQMNSHMPIKHRMQNCNYYLNCTEV